MISMGSSLRVGSAAAIFEEAAWSQSKKSVIINLQKGPYDHLADLVIHGFIDDIMNKLLEKLALEIPKWKIDRWAEIELKESKSGQETVHLRGINKQGEPF